MTSEWRERCAAWLLTFLVLAISNPVRANGNVTSTGGKSFTYNSQNQMLSMTSGSTSVSMVYDGFGNRVAKTVNGVTTRYLVEDDKNPTGYPQVFDELNSAGQVTRIYAYGLQRIDEEQVLNGAWTPSFYGYDGGGNVRQLTNSAGAVTDSYEYDAYGNHWTVEGSTPNNMLYRGEEWDADLSLLYLRARYMNTLTGRFLSRDPENGWPTDPVTLNKFLYANADPANLSDPLGRTADQATLPRQGTAGLEYAMLVQFIDLSVKSAVVVTGAAVECKLLWDGTHTLASGLNGELYQNRGYVYQNSPCTWALAPPRKNAVPAPFIAEDVVTTPGTLWGCSSAEDCEMRCSNGNTSYLHFDPGIQYGEGQHWDYKDCDGHTWKIWPDGTMTPANP